MKGDGSRLRGRWSLKHDCCLNCRSTERRHEAKGFCRRCHSNYRYHANIEAVKASRKERRLAKDIVQKEYPRVRQWHVDNAERVKAYKAEWHKKNYRYRFELGQAVWTEYCGSMCRGEICGLKWDAVQRSKDGPYLRVYNTRVIIDGGTADSSTKTDRPREVPIGDDTYRAIMSQPRFRTIEQGGRELEAKTEYVFTAASGRPMRPDTFSRDFAKFRDEIKMPGLKLHNLRHTYISLMLRAGLKTIQKNVGHASPKMIMEVYGETFDDQQRASVARPQAVFDQATAELLEASSSAS